MTMGKRLSHREATHEIGPPPGVGRHKEEVPCAIRRCQETEPLATSERQLFSASFRLGPDGVDACVGSVLSVARPRHLLQSRIDRQGNRGAHGLHSDRLRSPSISSTASLREGGAYAEAFGAAHQSVVALLAAGDAVPVSTLATVRLRICPGTPCCLSFGRSSRATTTNAHRFLRQWRIDASARLRHVEVGARPGVCGRARSDPAGLSPYRLRQRLWQRAGGGSGDSRRHRRGRGEPRAQLWITSKLWCNALGRDLVEPALRRTLADLQLDWLDLYLIHWPVPIRSGVAFPTSAQDLLTPDDALIRSTWEGMEAVLETGLTHHIGVSNFSSRKLHDLLDHCRIRPEVNQVELHPLLQQPSLVAD